MKTTLIRAICYVVALFGSIALAQPTIPPSNIYPVTGNSIVGNANSATGRAQSIPLGSGLEFQAGALVATGGGSGGAPSNATYITQTPNTTLTSEQALSLLGTGIMYSTTGSGIISTLPVPISATYGGTANAFTSFTGPTTSIKTFTLPNASATILTSAAPVTVAQGGTNQTAFTNGQVLIGNTTTGGLDKTTITAGDGVTITNGAGSITINATGTGGNVTNNATLTANRVVLGGGSAVIGVVASAGTTTTVLHGNASGAPSFGAVDIVNDTTGTLTVAKGGTGIASGTSGGIPYFSGSTAIGSSAVLASGNIVVGGGAGAAPTTSNLAVSGNNLNVPGNVTTDNLTVTNNQTIGNLSVTNLTVSESLLSSTVTDGQLFIGNNTGDRLELATLTAGTGVTITNGPGSITINATGTGGNVTNNSTLTANNIILGGGTTVIGPLGALGTTTTVLHGNASGAPSFGAVDIVNDTTGTLTVAKGGTGVATLTANAVITGNGTGAVTSVSPGTSGNILTSNGTAWTSAVPVASGNVTGSGLTSGAIVIGAGSNAISIGPLPGTSGNVLTSNGTAWTSAAGASAGNLTLSATLGSDDTYSGVTLAGLNAGATIAQWEAVYVDGSSTYQLADANGTGTYPARGLAVAAYSSSNAAVIIREGAVRNDAWNWTPGGTIYLSTTAGGLTQTAPSTSGDKIQQVGFALTADIAYVNFASGEYLTVP